MKLNNLNKYRFSDRGNKQELEFIRRAEMEQG